jgi:hypothetical protein
LPSRLPPAPVPAEPAVMEESPAVAAMEESAAVAAMEAEGAVSEPALVQSTPAEPAPVEPIAAEEPASPAAPVAVSHWLLSLFTPAADDAIDWTRGNYSVVPRSGRIESPARNGELKKQVNMVTEGSVLVAERPPQGAAPDVAPEGFPHPVYRAGFALAIPLPRVAS